MEYNEVQLKDFKKAELELSGEEEVFISQKDKTRNTLLSKIKDFIIGTNTMGTTATDVTGAVKELNDKIGSTEKEGSVIAQMNEKANLSDVKIFTSLSDIGLSLDDMTTDFGSNILKMIKAMGRNRKLVLYPYSAETNTNLYNSVKTWCEVNTDAYTLVIESSFNGAENLPNKIEVYPNTNTGNNRYFVGFYDNAMGKCREVAGLDSSISLPLRSTLVEYEGVASGYSNKIIKKDNGIIIIHFCVKKSDGSGIKANELLFIADIPVGYRIKSTFGVASAWAGFKPSLPYLDSGNVLVCRVTEDCTAVVGNIIGEAI